jgi:aldose 1-epimerase
MSAASWAASGNRIANASFDLDGKTHRVTANEGVNHLHGGAIGFGKRVWRVLDITERDAPRVILGYHSPDGEEGYPGNVEATVELIVKPDALSIILSARTDAATPINLTYHPYFNRAGRSEPCRPSTSGCASGESLSTRGTRSHPDRTDHAGRGHHVRFPREPTIAAADRPRPSAALARRGYDHCWVLAQDADCACELSSPNGT